MKRMYYKSKSEAKKALEKEKKERPFEDLHLFRKSKGTRKAGWYVVCSELTFLNLN